MPNAATPAASTPQSPDRFSLRSESLVYSLLSFAAANACCQPPDGSIKAERRQQDLFHLLLFTFNWKFLFFIKLIQRVTLFFLFISALRLAFFFFFLTDLFICGRARTLAPSALQQVASLCM